MKKQTTTMQKVRISGALSIMAGEVPKEEQCREEYCALLIAACNYAAAIDACAAGAGESDAKKLDLALVMASREAVYTAANKAYYKARKDAFFAEVRKAQPEVRLAVYAEMRSTERIRKVSVMVGKDGYSDCEVGTRSVEFDIGREEFAIFISTRTGLQQPFNALSEAMFQAINGSYQASAADEVTDCGSRVSKRALLRALSEIIRTATAGAHSANSADMRYLRDGYSRRVGACKRRAQAQEKFLTAIADVILHKLKGTPYVLEQAVKVKR